jgi:hypothetical protein
MENEEKFTISDVVESLAVASCGFGVLGLFSRWVYDLGFARMPGWVIFLTIIVGCLTIALIEENEVIRRGEKARRAAAKGAAAKNGVADTAEPERP